MYLSRACGSLLVAWLLGPAVGWTAPPDVFVAMSDADDDGPEAADAVGSGAPPQDTTPIALREGDVVPMPACDATLDFELRKPADFSRRARVVVRLLGHRKGGHCTLELLSFRTVGTGAASGEGSAAPSTGSRGPAALAAAAADLRATDVPCGSHLIEIREGMTSGSIATSQGTACPASPEDADWRQSSISVGWLDDDAAPPSPSPGRARPDAAAPRP